MMFLAVSWSLGGASAARADNDPDLRFAITDGIVNTVFSDGVNIYLGGNFSEAGPNTGHGAELNVANGGRDINGPLITGPAGSTVYAVVNDGDKGWFIGGDFALIREDPRGEIATRSSALKKFSRSHLTHIKNDKTVSRLLDAVPNGPVRALAYAASTKRLYVGGAFTDIDGESHLRVAAIDTTTGAPVTAWSPAIADGVVRAMALSTDGAMLFVGGDFTTVNGIAGIRGIAAIDTASGNLVASWGGSAAAVGAGEQINAMDVFDTKLYVAGNFSIVGGKARSNIAALAVANGVADDTWNPGTDGIVHALSVGNLGTFIYAGGAFSNLAGINRPRLGRLRLSDGSLDASWTPNIEDGEVRGLEARDNDSVPRVFVGGTFSRVNATAVRRGVALSASAQINWSVDADAPIESFSISSDSTRVFVGGPFRSIAMQARNNVAALHAARGDLTPWAPDVAGGEVFAFALSSDKKSVYLGGDFTSVAGTGQARIARVHAESGTLTPWRPALESGAVTTLALAPKGKNITRLAFTQDAVLAGTETGLYRSTDDGVSWTRVSDDIGAFAVTDIALDPNSAQTIYVATAGAGFLKSQDGGIHWDKINEKISNLNANAIAVASNSTTLYAGTDALTQTDGGFYRSDDAGASWTVLANGSVQTLAVHPTQPETVFAGTSIGLFRSDDRGAVFLSGGTGISDANIIRVVLAAKPGTDEINGYVLSANAFYFDYGLDGRWTPYTKLGVPANDFVVDPANENAVYASSLGNGIYALEATTTTAPVTADDPNSAIQKIAVESRWRQSNSGLTNTQAMTLAIDPNNRSRLAAGTSLGYVYLSVDSGQTWLERHSGIPTDVLYSGGTFTGSHPDFLAALDTSVSAANYFLDWNPNSSDRIESVRLANNDSTLYAGGAFTLIGGQARRRLAALDTATALATPWAPDVNDGVVNAIAFDSKQSTLYLGGTFTNVGNQTRNRLAAVRAADGGLSEWNPAANNEVTGLAVANEDNLVFVAGRFTNVGGESRSRIASLLTTTYTDNATAWSPNADLDFTRNSIAADNNTVYMGGNFSRLGDIGVQSFAGYTFAPPTVTITPLPQAYPDSQTISLACKDASGQACTGTVYYSLDTDLNNATWHVYSGPVLIPTSTQVSYYGQTLEGIRSKTITVKYTIDRQRPTVTVDVPSGTYPFTRTVSVLCADGDAKDISVANCGAIFYTEDGSTPVFTAQPDATTGVLGFSAPAGAATKLYIDRIPVRIDLTLRFVAVDRAGNVSEQGIARYSILRGEESAGYMGPGWILVLIASGVQAAKRRRPALRMMRDKGTCMDAVD